MARALQQRTLKTRAKLIGTAKTLIEQRGYAALRIEEVVLGAGVAKGTFFAHFKDKDALMDLLIGEEIDQHLDLIEAAEAPETVEHMVDCLMPMMRMMTCERYVFDVILRYSGATAVEAIGPIAMTFGRQMEVVSKWLENGPFRKDISPELQAEGVQAFLVQAMALRFCALHTELDMQNRVLSYLRAWLQP